MGNQVAGTPAVGFFVVDNAIRLERGQRGDGTFRRRYDVVYHPQPSSHLSSRLERNQRRLGFGQDNEKPALRAPGILERLRLRRPKHFEVADKRGYRCPVAVEFRGYRLRLVQAEDLRTGIEGQDRPCT